MIKENNQTSRSRNRSVIASEVQKGADIGENVGSGDMPQGESNIGSGTDKIPMSVEKKDAPKKNFLEINCPYCFGADFVKRGTRQKVLNLQRVWRKYIEVNKLEGK